MQIYLVHPDHGRKIAEMSLEADSDKKNGWQEVTYDEFYNRDIGNDESEPKKRGLPKNALA